jgi:hypothetical protein
MHLMVRRNARKAISVQLALPSQRHVLQGHITTVLMNYATKREKMGNIAPKGHRRQLSVQ